MTQDTLRDIHSNFYQVFHEIFEKAYSLNKNAVALFVMSGFLSKPGIEKLSTFDKYVCKYIDQLPQIKSEDMNILSHQVTCWWLLEIFESPLIQNILLNLFHIIGGECIDDICNFWQQNETKNKGSMRQIVIDKSKKYNYHDKLQLNVIYSQDIRNNIAHGSYFLSGSDRNICVLSPRRKRDENILEDFFGDEGSYDRIPFSEFFGGRMNVICAFYHHFVVTYLEYFEKYYRNYSFEFEYLKNDYECRITLDNNRSPAFELKKLANL